jgi:hypothetical protein
MGYCIEIQGQRIRIKQENFQPAFEALKAVEAGGWTNSPEAAASLEDLLFRWRWQPRLLLEKDPPVKGSKVGDIVYLEFLGEKLAEDEEMFRAIAQWIEPDCFVEIYGEDGQLWRWVFNGVKMYQTECIMDWDGKCNAFDAILKHKDMLPNLIGIHPALDGAIEGVLKPRGKHR